MIADPKRPWLDRNSQVIQTWFALTQQRYMQDLPAPQRYSETPACRMSLTHFQASPLTSVRTEDIARTLPHDYCAVIWLQKGHGHWFDNGHYHRLQPGDVLFIHAATPFTFHFAEEYQVISINLPISLWKIHGHMAPKHGQYQRLDLLKQRQLTHCIEHLEQCLDVNTCMQHTIKQIQQAEWQLSQSLSSCFSPLRADINANFDALCRLMQAQMHNESFNIDQLTQLSGLSRRGIFNAFSHNKLTPQRYLHQLRLIDAFRQLTTLQKQHLSLYDIALDCGFKTQAHFCRLFKAHFDISPMAARKALHIAQQ